MARLIISIIIGIIIGVSEALVYFSGVYFSARLIAPYAAAAAMLILALTCIIASAIGCWRNRNDENRDLFSFIAFGNYIKAIVLSSSIFLVFTQILVGMTPSGIFKTLLVFLGSTSFWVMLITFISFTFRITRR